ncbi:MAG TPA: hypothetical protein VMI12_17095 [Puia sp.]|nr:hypothetical protein [Puia sp.]
MRNNNQIKLDNSFSRAILTGLFLGICATLVCFIYSITYRSITSFYLSFFVNVTWIIFGCNLALLTAGIVYSGFKKNFRYGNVFFVILFIAIALFGLWKVGSIQRSDIQIISQHFRGLLSGIIIIITVGIILIPVLYGNRKFQDNIILNDLGI